MARRKRASMREGPLADLFRATVEPEDPPPPPDRSAREPEDETRVIDEQPPPEPPAREAEQPSASPYGVGVE